MTKLHRAGFFISVAAVALAFIGFWAAGTAAAIEFSSSYFWVFVVLPLALAATVTGLSFKWPLVGGCAGVITPFFLFFTLEMDTFYRNLYTAVILVYFAGAAILLIEAIKKPLKKT